MDSVAEEIKNKRKYERALADAELMSLFAENESDDDRELQQQLRRSKTLSKTHVNQQELSIAEKVKQIQREQDKFKTEQAKKREELVSIISKSEHFSEGLKDVRADLLTERQMAGDEDLTNLNMDREYTFAENEKRGEQVRIDDIAIVSGSVADALKYAKNRGFDRDKNAELLIGVKERRERADDVSSKKNVSFMGWSNKKVLNWAKKAGLPSHIVSVIRKKKFKGSDMQPSKLSLRKVWELDDMQIIQYKDALGELTGDPCPEIQLPYIGTDGQPMTKSDAFRSQSHTFHGKKPGKKNTEKRLRQHQEERNRKSSANAFDTALGIVGRMKEVMAVDAKPYVVLEGESSKRIRSEDKYDGR